jgi:uncharacterized membrane protein YqjE
MEKIFTEAEELAGTLKEYVDTRMESAKLVIVEKSSALLANMLAGLFLLIVFFFCMLFGGIALSVALGQWMGAPWAGFLVVAALYLVIGILVWAARGKLIRLPFMNAIIQQLFADDEED